MAVAPADLVLDSLRGDGYPLRDWLTSYPMLLVAIDPYTHESSWILETAGRILDLYAPADVRVGWLVTADDEGCRQFLADWADRYLVFTDADRSVVKAFGIERVPSLVFVRGDGWVEAVDGWDPVRWRELTEIVSKLLRWTRPMIPRPGDPTPYEGTPAVG